MPSGACTALDDITWANIKKEYDNAVKHGLQYEWLQFFVGGLVINKLDPIDAAYEAAIEWDI